MKRFLLVLLVAALFASPLFAEGEAEQMTEFGTKRAETLIIQTFDARSSAPDSFNYYLTARETWHGSRMLGFAYLWETDTGTGETVGELGSERCDRRLVRHAIRERVAVKHQ